CSQIGVESAKTAAECAGRAGRVGGKALDANGEAVAAGVCGAAINCLAGRSDRPCAGGGQQWSRQGVSRVAVPMWPFRGGPRGPGAAEIRKNRPAGFLPQAGPIVALAVRRQNGAAGRNAEISACFCTSLLVISANPKIWSLCRNYSQSGVGLFNPTFRILPGVSRVAK